MRNYLIIILILFSFQNEVLSQQYQPVQIIQNFEGNYTTDPLGNIYRYTRGDIVKYDLNGIQAGSFSSRDYGDISYIDASNPMKILVVYEKFSKALVLDAGLSANFTIDLIFPGSPIISLICISTEEGYWIYDPIGMQLKRINSQLTIISEGTSLRQISESTIEPKQIYDSGQWLILNAPGFGILIFDRYGTYFKTLKADTVAEIQIRNMDEIMYKEETVMASTNIKTGEIKKFTLPDNMPQDHCRVESNRIFVKTENTLKIYSY